MGSEVPVTRGIQAKGRFLVRNIEVKSWTSEGVYEKTLRVFPSCDMGVLYYYGIISQTCPQGLEGQSTKNMLTVLCDVRSLSADFKGHGCD